MYPIVNGIVVSHGYKNSAMHPVPNPDTGTSHRSYPHSRIQAFPTRIQRRIDHEQPLPGLPRRALMHQLDAHSAGVDRPFDRKPVRIVRGTVVEATLALVLGQLRQGVNAVYEFGDFGPSGWSRDALPIVVVGQRGQICC